MTNSADAKGKQSTAFREKTQKKGRQVRFAKMPSPFRPQPQSNSSALPLRRMGIITQKRRV
ncbi:hypothetical protein C5Y96_18805 [Blastopirellula marina]|uniref:Uncharacterized protein n=1 Tax=Blastopirellula marina TaxID=124 RepID=A0A2S8F5Z1_9BACT|nr:hypothetical protein C5Y96_18805 [Blastopirellula marina]RCS48116.1 hypothetical protein DTL36_18830 [Bremerella cremea]